MSSKQCTLTLTHYNRENKSKINEPITHWFSILDNFILYIKKVSNDGTSNCFEQICEFLVKYKLSFDKMVTDVLQILTFNGAI